MSVQPDLSRIAEVSTFQYLSISINLKSRLSAAAVETLNYVDHNSVVK